MYCCPICGNVLGSEAMIGEIYGENPKKVYCNKCYSELSIRLPYSPPLKRPLILNILLGILSIIELVAGFFLMSHVWRSIESVFLSFLGAAGIVILTVFILLISLFSIFHKLENPYAHGYNDSFAMEKRNELEREAVSMSQFCCVLNVIFIAVSYFVAIKHLF